MGVTSLSARRAWIEIMGRHEEPFRGGVALRKESVDRNSNREINICIAGKSLSARRAWIEIQVGSSFPGADPGVALRKESVDRNQHGLGENGSYLVALRKESVDRNS